MKNQTPIERYSTTKEILFFVLGVTFSNLSEELGEKSCGLWQVLAIS
jgi:hypothetical protein